MDSNLKAALTCFALAALVAWIWCAAGCTADDPMPDAGRSPAEVCKDECASSPEPTCFDDCYCDAGPVCP